MSLNYVVRKAIDPSSPTGAIVYQARTKQKNMLTTAQFCKFVSEQCSATAADVRCVLSALATAVDNYASMSNIVSLGDFGVIRYTIGTQLVSKAENFKKSNIRGARMSFIPGKLIKEALKSVDLVADEEAIPQAEA